MNPNHYRIARTFAVLLLLPAVTSFGQETKKDEINRAIVIPDESGGSTGQPLTDTRQPKQHHVKYVSKKEPVPALTYRLFPSRGERKPGDSVPFYYRTLLTLQSQPQSVREEFDRIQSEFRDSPLHELIKPENIERIRKAAGYLHEYQIENNLLEAVYRDHTNWDLQMNRVEGPEFVSFLLPEAQEMRQLARIMHFRSRLAAAEGNYERALQSCLISIKAGYDVAEQPTLISDLVGVSMASIALNDISDMISQTDCPNLYWTLAALPDPLVSIREGIEHEAMLPEFMFPFLKDPETAEKTPEEWARLLREMLFTLYQLEGSAYSGDRKWKAVFDLAGAGMMARSYPTAKRELIADGWDRTRIESMPVGQVVAIYQRLVTRTLFDDTLKWSLLPYASSEPYKKQLEDDLSRMRIELPEPAPIAALLLPAVMQAKSAEGRLQSRIKGLMVLEAIRLHASKNDGQVPRTLDEITVVPVPECPLTNEPYEYQFKDNVATLYVPADTRESLRYIGWEFHLKSK